MVYLLAIQGMFYSNIKFYNDLQIVVKEVSFPIILDPSLFDILLFFKFCSIPKKDLRLFLHLI